MGKFAIEMANGFGVGEIEYFNRVWSVAPTIRPFVSYHYNRCGMQKLCIVAARGAAGQARLLFLSIDAVIRRLSFRRFRC